MQKRERFHVLDGLRGVAAVVVVVFHFMEMIYSNYSKNFLAHGFLAVDFFFCLSGFVIAYAYDSRIARIGAWAFFKARLIRLHPMVVIGSVIGFLGLLVDLFTGILSLDVATSVVTFITSILLIPYPNMEARYYNLFSINAPAWSLFWEYIANVLYVYIFCNIRQRALLVCIVIAAVALGYIAYTSPDLMGGWGKSTFWNGGARMAYSFLMGIFVYRAKWIIKNNIGFVGLSILLLLAFAMPYRLAWNPYTEMAVILFYFPLLVALGAGSGLSERIKKICVFSGDISYPIYTTHFAAIWLYGNYYLKVDKSRLATDSLWEIGAITGVCVVLVFFFAYLLLKFYDAPLRKYLRKRFL